MNLLIVDDERLIVNYLVSLVETNLDADLNIQKAYSAPEALEILSAQKIDLMLLDIQMPGCTGLELAETVSSSWPKCRIIFLTAYDNFDYLYQANRLPRTSYLLKTEPDNVLLNEIQKNLDAIAEERQQKIMLDDTQKKTRLLNHLLHQNILREILTGRNIEQLKNELRLAGSDFHLDLSQPVYLVYMMAHLRSIDEYTCNISTLSMDYLYPAEELLQGSFTCAMLNLNHGSMLWFLQPTNQFQKNIQTKLAFLKGFSDDLVNYSTTVLHRNLDMILYPEAVSWGDVSNIHYKLLQQLEITHTRESRLQSSVSVYAKQSRKSALPVNSTNPSSADQKIQALSFYLYQNTPNEYFQMMDELHQQCRSYKSMHSLDALRIYLGISVTLISYVDLYQLQEKLSTKVALYPLYHLMDFSNWDDAFRYLKKFSECLFSLLSSNATDKNETVIRTIKNYIKEHLAELISLASLSAIVNYNETYISRLFRQTTGIKLSEYIYQERIAKAKFLLSTSGDSIQSIAAATGFDSQQYFSLVFKKSVGISPSEYQRIHYTK